MSLPGQDCFHAVFGDLTDLWAFEVAVRGQVASLSICPQDSQGGCLLLPVEVCMFVFLDDNSQNSPGGTGGILGVVVQKHNSMHPCFLVTQLDCCHFNYISINCIKTLGFVFFDVP